jgi:hypothetical protein
MLMHTLYAGFGSVEKQLKSKGIRIKLWMHFWKYFKQFCLLDCFPLELKKFSLGDSDCCLEVISVLRNINF